MPVYSGGYALDLSVRATTMPRASIKSTPPSPHWDAGWW
jgi:hypothetical protein